MVLGVTVAIQQLSGFRSLDPLQYLSYAVLSLLASILNVGYRTDQGVIPLNLLFILISLRSLSAGEAMLLAVVSSFASEYSRKKLFDPIRRIGDGLFAASASALAVAMGDLTIRGTHLPGASGELNEALRAVLMGATYFVCISFPWSMSDAFTNHVKLHTVWRERYFWMLPYYVAGAVIAGLFDRARSEIGWQIPVLLVPVVYLFWRSYRIYMAQLEAGRIHAEELASLHLRTIEALALAIDAKDQTTHSHLQRVQVYAVEIGKELGLEGDDLDALRAASLLHDIGKLAVPEHIISKPGRLTPEEFEKMKIHPVVGAEILERVQFPYPVVPIVRSHHEKWDGTGYPDGLAKEQIPIGARILATVDCLDALASDRQYRKALPLDQAIGVVVHEAGKSFDPRIVEILARRYVDLERMAQLETIAPLKLSRELPSGNVSAPMAGYEGGAAAKALAVALPSDAPEFLSKIAAARQEAHALFELVQSLGNSLSLDETLSVLSVRLKRVVPYDAMAVYLRRDHRLLPEFVSGENFRLFASLEIPVGQGLSGWVAENSKPIINGNPSVEPGYLNDPAKFSTLRAALAVPLVGVNGAVIGVLALYHGERDIFTKDHLRILLAVSSKLSLTVENAVRYQQAEASATTDFLTGLPNARSLFLHLERELGRAAERHDPLAVLVCDIDSFKQINDEHGHLEGNNVLKSVARSLSTSCRQGDYVARMGGDEFVVIMPGLDADALPARLEHLRKCVSDGARVETSLALTISIGAALYPRDGSSAESLLDGADRSMYKVKSDGRKPVKPSIVEPLWQHSAAQVQ
jgi:diguanylate cyclase (GGDEF)-like protein/putative nucleotidyltransferase with HDIG domain